MAHNLEFRNGEYSFAFTGDRGAVWHRLGQQMADGATAAEWIAASGFDYRVLKVPAVASLIGPDFDHLSGRFAESDKKFIVRQDSGRVLGIASDGYKPVQPADVWEWFERYITIDERFHIDAAGVLGSGERLWISAQFQGDQTIAGDRHLARLLMSTSFDSSQATRNEATMTRVVCQNTLRLAHANAKALIKTRHSTAFNGAAVARELSQIASSFAEFKAMGDAMAQVAMTGQQVSDFFKRLLDVDPAVNMRDKDKVSTRTANIFDGLKTTCRITQQERNSDQHDVWTALQAVTRYVDHDRTVRNASNENVGRFDSGTFGSGDAMKGKALELLLPMVDKSLFRAPVAA
jgi:phage/plasmid-like protein (TIGR03299 family)